MKNHLVYTADGDGLLYKSGGIGQTIILLHGFGIDSVIWKRVFPLLQKNFRVVLVDLPGYGLNVALWKGNVAVFTQFFNALFLAEKNAYVLGYSFGGNMLLRHVLKNGVRQIFGIILLSTPVKGGLLSYLFSLFLKAFSFSKNASEWLVLLLTSLKIRMFLIAKTSLIPLKNKVIIDFCVNRLVSFKNPAFLCESLSFVFQPLIKREVLNIRAVGLFGELDGFVKKEGVENLFNTLFAHYKTFVIPQTHHLSALENPNKLAEAIVKATRYIK